MELTTIINAGDQELLSGLIRINVAGSWWRSPCFLSSPLRK